MRIQARYAGKCRTCGGRIAKGDTVEWQRRRGARHVVCTPATGKVAQARRDVADSQAAYNATRAKPVPAVATTEEKASFAKAREIHTNAPEVKEAIRAAFPSYKGRTFSVAPLTFPFSCRSYWSGGSRTSYAVVNLAEEKAKAVPQNGSPFDGGELKAEGLPAGYAIASHSIFCGKDMGCTLYVLPENLNPRMLPPAVTLAWPEKVVLSAISCLKASYGGVKQYRRTEACRQTDITPAEYEGAKAVLVDRGLLTKAGALSTEGKNAAGQVPDLRGLQRPEGVPVPEVTAAPRKPKASEPWFVMTRRAGRTRKYKAAARCKTLRKAEARAEGLRPETNRFIGDLRILQAPNAAIARRRCMDEAEAEKVATKVKATPLADRIAARQGALAIDEGTPAPPATVSATDEGPKWRIASHGVTVKEFSVPRLTAGGGAAE